MSKGTAQGPRWSRTPPRRSFLASLDQQGIQFISGFSNDRSPQNNKYEISLRNGPLVQISPNSLRNSSTDAPAIFTPWLNSLSVNPFQTLLTGSRHCIGTTIYLRPGLRQGYR